MRFGPFKIISFLVLLSVLLLVIQVFKERERQFNQIPPTMVNVSALDVSGNKTNYAREKGYATLIVLSASWCPACMAELPSLKNIHKEFSPKGLNILMVSEDDNLNAARKFKNKYSMPWTVVHWNYDLMNALGNPRVLPVSYLVNGNDEFVLIEAGIMDEQKMRSEIERILE